MKKARLTWSRLTLATAILTALKLLGIPFFAKLSWWIVWIPFLIMPLICLVTVIGFFFLLVFASMQQD